MQVVLRKMDKLIELKIGAIIGGIEGRQDKFEAKLATKVIELKREFREIQLKREKFYN